MTRYLDPNTRYYAIGDTIYAVSELGEVFKTKTGKILEPNGLGFVRLSIGGKQHRFHTHDLLCHARDGKPLGAMANAEQPHLQIPDSIYSIDDDLNIWRTSSKRMVHDARPGLVRIRVGSGAKAIFSREDLLALARGVPLPEHPSPTGLRAAQPSARKASTPKLKPKKAENTKPAPHRESDHYKVRQLGIELRDAPPKVWTPEPKPTPSFRDDNRPRELTAMVDPDAGKRTRVKTMTIQEHWRRLREKAGLPPLE